MIEKGIENIFKEDLVMLKENEVLESRTIEYKQTLPENTRDSKIKFLAGVSSFANATGGDFIIGIVEKQGKPSEIKGIETDNTDEVKLRLEQLIKDGLKPRIPSVIIRDICLTNGNVVFILRISQSWIGPHRVTLGGHDRFYSRNTAGKYQMDVDELRNAFVFSETIEKGIENFRRERISKVATHATPITLLKGTKVILHFIPLASMRKSVDYELEKHFSRNQYPRGIFRAIIEADWRFNFDGFLYYNLLSEADSDIYVQIFRNGIIEFVDGRCIRHTNGKKMIYTLDLERELISSFSLYLKLLKNIEVALPIFAFLSIIDVKGYYLGVGYQDRIFQRRKKHEIEKNVLLFPEIKIENYDEEVKKIIMPWFNKIWNAGGYEKCPHVDENGHWKDQDN